MPHLYTCIYIVVPYIEVSFFVDITFTYFKKYLYCNFIFVPLPPTNHIPDCSTSHKHVHHQRNKLPITLTAPLIRSPATSPKAPAPSPITSAAPETTSGLAAMATPAPTAAAVPAAAPATALVLFLFFGPFLFAPSPATRSPLFPCTATALGFAALRRWS